MSSQNVKESTVESMISLINNSLNTFFGNIIAGYDFVLYLSFSGSLRQIKLFHHTMKNHRLFFVYGKYFETYFCE